MKNRSRHRILRCILVIALVAAVHPRAASTPSDTKAKADVMLSTMQEEMQRAQSSLGKLDPAPYFLSYSVYDQSIVLAVGRHGSLVNSTRARRRAVDVRMRIGTTALNNAHAENRSSASTPGFLPLEDDRNAIAHELWRLTYLNVKTKTQVHAQEEDTSPDFSQEKPPTSADYKEVAADPDQRALEKLVREYPAHFRKHPYNCSSSVMIDAQKTRFHFLSTEGNHVIAPSAFIRVAIEAETRADDGMELMRVETFQAESFDHLSAESEITARVEKT
jgi:hypothetical protein